MNKNIDWDHQEEFEFIFDIGLAPEFEVELNQKLKVPFYSIAVDEEMINKSVEDITRTNGKFIEADKVGSEDMLKGDLRAVDADGNPIEGGTFTENVILSLPAIKNETIKNQFVSKATADTIVFDVKQAFPLDTDRIAMLRVDKKDIHKTEGLFSLFIKEIKRYEKSDINQELFDKVYGPIRLSRKMNSVKRFPRSFPNRWKAKVNTVFQSMQEKFYLIQLKSSFPQTSLNAGCFMQMRGK